MLINKDGNSVSWGFPCAVCRKKFEANNVHIEIKRMEHADRDRRRDFSTYRVYAVANTGGRSAELGFHYEEEAAKAEVKEMEKALGISAA